MNIYLDIHGVLIDRFGNPAAHVDEFIESAVKNFPVFWLSTYFRSRRENPLKYLGRYPFSPKTLDKFRQIKIAEWRTQKIEAIDFSQPFYWLEDCPTTGDLAVLKSRGLQNSLIKINLEENPDQLMGLAKIIAA